jgi:endoglucanase
LNPKLDGDIYQGDCLEIYLGFRENQNSGGYGPDDYQLGIGMNQDKIATWIWNKGVKIQGSEIITKLTERGYTLEAKIPLSNFKKDNKIKAGDTVWIDFAIDDGKGKGIRSTQIVWNGDGEGWQTPKTWKKAKLYDDQSIFLKPYILTPPQITANAYNRIYFYYNGKPFIGAVKVGAKKYETDNTGGITLMTSSEGGSDISFNYGSGTFSLSTTVEKKKEIIFVKLPVKNIKVNQLGYLDNEKKVFVITDNEGKLKIKEFKIVDPYEEKKILYKGKIKDDFKEDITSEDKVSYGDFSDFTKHGKFKIIIDGFGESYVFEIDDDIFSKLFYTTTRSYYLQRCGMAVDDKKISGVSYAQCHTEDAAFYADYKKTGEIIKKDTTGGWHDAGDYGKYMPTAGLAVTQLLMIYELTPGKFNNFKLDIPESNNNFPDLLDEVKYELDWMLKMQDKNGGVYHKVNTYNFPPAITPDLDKEQRFIFEISTASTAIFAGSMAYAARIYEKAMPEYGKQLRKTAIEAGKFLLDNLDKVLWASKDNTGLYKTGAVNDELFWAFCELYRLTGDNKYYKNAMKFIGIRLDYPIIGWDNTYVLGLYALYFNDKTPKEQKDEIKNFIEENSSKWIERIMTDGYNCSLSSSEFTWSSNKNACAKGLMLIMAYQMSKKEEYKQAARYQLDYILGVNTLSKSFITGVGTDYVRYPHHRYVISTEKLMPGFLIGGPNNNAECGTYDKGQGPRGYRDVYQSFSCNEYAIDYNAPLVFLAGYFMKDKPGDIFQGKATGSHGLPLYFIIIICIIVILLIGAMVYIFFIKKKH